MGYKISGHKKSDPIGPTCKKKSYHTLAEAQDMINHIKENRVSPVIRAYKCPSCAFWHLTSKY